ncbi:MAG: S41 family peptidase [Bacteroidota bacterium]
MNKKWLPFVFGIMLAIGIIIGIYLAPGGMSSSGNKKLYELIRLIDEVYVDSVDDRKLEEKAIREMLASLDPHSVYFTPDELKIANEQLDGNFEGIGVEFTILNDTVMVVAPIEGGPSKELGIMAGDRITHVNDTLIAGVGITNEQVFKKLRGPKATQVQVSIYRPDAARKLTYTITRNTIAVKSVDTRFLLNDQTGYIKVSRFALETANEFAEALKELKATGKLSGLIIDLRGNPGGYLAAVIEMADQLLDNRKLIVYTQGRNQPRIEYKAEKTGLFEQGKLVVLIDEGSASASEILAGAVQDNDRGLVVGRRSFGKGLVQEPFELKDGSGLRLTVSRYYTPSGRCIQKPYDKGAEQYEHELIDRFDNGELEKENTTKSATDTSVYLTLKGRKVYAGGGIMPDFFVPIDTSYRHPYISALLSQNLINRFAAQYADKNRVTLKKYTSAADFERMFNEDVVSELIQFASQNGVQPVQWNKSIALYLNLQVKAVVARQIWRDEGYYRVQATRDPMMQKALLTLQKYTL